MFLIISVVMGANVAVAGEKYNYNEFYKKYTYNKYHYNKRDVYNSSIADIVVNSNGFDTLQFALETAGLVDLLDGKDKYTVFAPTDEAFQKLADVLTDGDVTALATALVNADLLDDVLAYHVVNYKRSPGNILKSGTLNALSGQKLETGVDNNGLYIKGVNNERPTNFVVDKGINASNGKIYPIDQVLINIDPAVL